MSADDRNLNAQGMKSFEPLVIRWDDSVSINLAQAIFAGCRVIASSLAPRAEAPAALGLEIAFENLQSRDQKLFSNTAARTLQGKQLGSFFSSATITPLRHQSRSGL